MPARRFLVNVDLNKNELQNPRAQNLATAPSSPVSGQFYFDTGSSRFRYYDGTEWVDATSAEGTITSVSGTSPIETTGTTSVTISILAASGSNPGSMSSAHWTKLEGIESGATANSSDSFLLDRANHTGTQDIATISGLQDALDDKIDTSEKGAVNGVATLDGNQKVPTNQLPSIAITETFVVADITARDALDPETGDVAIVQDRGDGEPASYIWDGTEWQKLLSPTKGVTEVTGGTGITSTGGDTPEISITAGGVGTTQLADEAVTEDKLSTDVQTKLNAPTGALKYSETIGDTTETDFTINHDFDTRDVVVTVYEAASPFAQVEAIVEHTDANNVTVKFSVAPANDEYRVVVVG